MYKLQLTLYSASFGICRQENIDERVNKDRNGKKSEEDSRVFIWFSTHWLWLMWLWCKSRIFQRLNQEKTQGFAGNCKEKMEFKTNKWETRSVPEDCCSRVKWITHDQWKTRTDLWAFLSAFPSDSKRGSFRPVWGHVEAKVWAAIPQLTLLLFYQHVFSYSSPEGKCRSPLLINLLGIFLHLWPRFESHMFWFPHQSCSWKPFLLPKLQRRLQNCLCPTKAKRSNLSNFSKIELGLKLV